MITQEELIKKFSYDSESGNLISLKKNKPVGTVNGGGYLIVRINYKFYYVHQLVYIYHYGSIPENCVIDHIDHVRQNNRIENLQAIRNSENSRKKRYNWSGHKNIVKSLRDENKWDIKLRIGPFDTIDKAIEHLQKISS